MTGQISQTGQQERKYLGGVMRPEPPELSSTMPMDDGPERRRQAKKWNSDHLSATASR